MKPPKARPITRLLQVTLSRDAYVLLGKLIQQRVEKDFAPSKATKGAVIADAIVRLAVHEGLIPEPAEEKPKEPTTAPFQIVAHNG
jgi:hypothetical protein